VEFSGLTRKATNQLLLSPCIKLLHMLQTFWDIILTSKQRSSCENITFVAEVTKAILTSPWKVISRHTDFSGLCLNFKEGHHNLQVMCLTTQLCFTSALGGASCCQMSLGFWITVELIANLYLVSNQSKLYYLLQCWAARWRVLQRNLKTLVLPMMRLTAQPVEGDRFRQCRIQIAWCGLGATAELTQRQ